MPGSPGTALITMDEAKARLRITHNDEDDDIESMMVDATEIVLNRLGSFADDTWDIDTVPGPIRAAILNQLRVMFEYDRKDDGSRYLDDYQYKGYLHPSVEKYLYRYRDPPLA